MVVMSGGHRAKPLVAADGGGFSCMLPFSSTRNLRAQERKPTLSLRDPTPEPNASQRAT